MTLVDQINVVLYTWIVYAVATGWEPFVDLHNRVIIFLKGKAQE